MDTKRAKELNKVRWGDKLVCRIVTRSGLREAECKWNGEGFIGRGEDTLSAIKNVFKQIK